MGAELGTDPRRLIPRTDALLADPGVAEYVQRLGAVRVKQVVTQTQQRARGGEIPPDGVLATTITALGRIDAAPGSFTPVINATGVVVHTNIGRAPLSPAAVEALAGQPHDGLARSQTHEHRAITEQVPVAGRLRIAP